MVNIKTDAELYAEVGRLTADVEKLADKVADLEWFQARLLVYAAQQKQRADKAESDNEVLKQTIRKMWSAKSWN